VCLPRKKIKNCKDGKVKKKSYQNIQTARRKCEYDTEQNLVTALRRAKRRVLVLAPLKHNSMEQGVLLEKLTAPQLVKKFPTFYGTRRFITAFTRARHLFLS